MTIGIISDIHGNLEALNAVLEELQGTDEIFCLGDLVGYGTNPNECVDIIRKHCSKVVAGNHDLAAAGLLSTQYWTCDAIAAIEWTKSVLTPDNTKYLKNLPTVIEYKDMTFVHGSPRNTLSTDTTTGEYIRTVADAAPCFKVMRSKMCFIGHSHCPQAFYEDNTGNIQEYDIKNTPKIQVDSNKRYIINVGSVGQPRDGNPEASFGVFEMDAMTINRVKYDIEKVQAKMAKSDFPKKLIQRIKDGL